MKRPNHVPTQCTPEKSVWILVYAARKARGITEVSTKRWHVYVDLTECRPKWIKAHKMFGKQETVTGMEVDAYYEDDNERKKHLNAKAEKPLFFTSNTQFWACWEQMAVIWECSRMFSRREIRLYKYFLLQQQEIWRYAGCPIMFLWVYDMCLRKSLAKRTEDEDPTLDIDAMLTTVQNYLILDAEDELPKWHAAFPGTNGLPAAAFPPALPNVPNVTAGSEVQAQSNALLAESRQILEKMRAAAERGADTVARSGQLAQKFAEAQFAAKSAQDRGAVKYDGGDGKTIKNHTKNKNGHGKGSGKGKHQQVPPGLGKKFYKDGEQLRGKARKAAYNDSIKYAKKNGTYAKKYGNHN